MTYARCILLALVTMMAVHTTWAQTSTLTPPPPTTPDATPAPTPYPTPQPPTPSPNPNTPTPGRTQAAPTLPPLENQTLAGGTYAAQTSAPVANSADLPLETWLIVLLVFIGVILCGLMIYAAKRGRQSYKDKQKHADRLDKADKDFDERVKKIAKL